MKRISTDQAQEDLLALIDELDDQGVVITDDGKPVARLSKYPSKFAKYIGSLKDEIEINGDIMDVRDQWEKGRQW